jgi:hypothetical protein
MLQFAETRIHQNDDYFSQELENLQNKNIFQKSLIEIIENNTSNMAKKENEVFKDILFLEYNKDIDVSNYRFFSDFMEVVIQKLYEPTEADIEFNNQHSLTFAIISEIMDILDLLKQKISDENKIYYLFLLTYIMLYLLYECIL